MTELPENEPSCFDHMDRRTAFFTEFADLLQRHGVSLIVRETVESYQLVADGIDIDFEYRVEDHPQAGSKLGLYIDADSIQKLVV